MKRLDVCDVHRLGEVVAEIDSLSDDLAFPPETLGLLGTLIPADEIAFAELDHVGHRYLGYSNRDFEGTDDPDAAATFWRLEPQHPLGAYQRSTVDFNAMRISDVVTRREFHRLEIYSAIFLPAGVEYELALGLPAPLTHTKTFLFNRASTDFSERDKLLLDLLKPHLIRRYQRWKLQQRTAAGLARVTQSGADPALLILQHDGSIDLAQRTVRRLLRDYFGEGDRGFAPAAVQEWATDNELLDDLVVEGTEGQLVVSVISCDANAQKVLLLHERRREAPLTQRLTSRERDVLDLVGDGKSNAEISRLLWVQPSTIRKHLENAYAKLNVGSRTEATALLRREATHSSPRVT